MIRLRAGAVGGMALKAAGTLLLLAGVGLGALTERNLVLHRVAVQRHGGLVADVGDGGPQAGLHGGMVRVSGPLQVIEPARDAEFNQTVPTPVLVRRVEMFQWREVRVGGDVHYELDWADRPLDATDFKQPAGHVNPGEFPVRGKQFDAGQVRVGGYALDTQLLHALPGTQRVEPDLRHLPPNLAASFSLYQDRLVTSANPANPRLGDVRVSWDAVPLQEVTVFARPEGDRLVPAGDAADGKGYEIQVGDRALTDVLPDVPLAPEFVQVRRAVAVLLAALGALALLWEHRRRDALLALGIGVALVAGVGCVLWLGGGWSIALGWLLAAAVGVAVAVWRLRRPG
ncbi:hypothetical protein ASG87_01755 [Frateuria sp. Soil773]|uniref:TMEM43 family protein n=1 Tax=Frateuria sp. Soil773 TaxID=1736407 RepID=UPI0006F969D1|nr:TMEM43 family protein [Frateuria sp. Soil773]KRE90888.1 hypothetical protein ASG87_01755 [Frateuria sp. Soil773]